jgi:hypothetical protein
MGFMTAPYVKLRTVLLCRCSLRRQDRAFRHMQYRSLLGDIRLVERTAPMPSVGLTRISEQGAVLDAFGRYVDPLLIHEHLHAACGKAIHRRAAIPVIAAAPASLVPQMRVDVMGLDRQRQVGDENGGHKGSS